MTKTLISISRDNLAKKIKNVQGKPIEYKYYVYGANKALLGLGVISVSEFVDNIYKIFSDQQYLKYLDKFGDLK